MPFQRFFFTDCLFCDRIIHGGLAKIHFHPGIGYLSFFLKNSGGINIQNIKTEEHTL